MTRETPIRLTDEHLLLFGRLVQSFAHYEILMEEIMAWLSGADVTSIRLLTKDLTITKKQQALFDLFRHRAVPRDQVDQVRSYLQMLVAYTPLRNDVAHSLWVEVKPQNAISPIWLTHGPLTAVKPLHDLDSGAKDFVENDEDRVTYTRDQLTEIVQNLETNFSTFQQYVSAVGFVRSPAA